MSKIPSLHFQIEIWAIVFSISSLINFEIVYIWPIPKFGEEDLVYNSFLYFFFHPKESCTLFEILIFLLFVKLSLVLSQSELSRTELPKCSHSAERCISLPFFFHLSFLISPFLFRKMQPPTPTFTPVLLTQPITGKYQTLSWYSGIRETENN